MVAFTVSFAWSWSVTSAVLGIALPPSASISRTTSLAGSPLSPSPCKLPPRSLTTTRAPSRAKASAYSRPMPRPAPVMSATLSESLCLFLLMSGPPTRLQLSVVGHSNAGRDRLATGTSPPGCPSWNEECTNAVGNLLSSR